MPEFSNPLKGLSKKEAYVATGGAVIIGGYFVIHHHSTTGSWNPWSSAAQTTNSAGDSTTIDPVTGLAYSEDDVTDPITGLPYLQEATEYGSVTAAESSVSAYGQSTASGSGIGVNPASPQSSGTLNTPVGSDVYTSNAAWSQAVQAGLTDVGYNATDVSTALGLYLTGQPMTAAQGQLINAAIAEYGNPPIGTYQITLIPSTTASTVTTGTSPTVPSATSLPIPAMPSGVSVSNVTTTGFVVHWSPDAHASSYRVRVTYQSALATQVTVGPVASAKITGLSANRTYTVHVAASNSSGMSSETNGPAVKTS